MTPARHWAYLARHAQAHEGEDLVAASKRSVDAQLEWADVNGNTLPSKAEARKRAKEFVVMMEPWAHAVDKNRDADLQHLHVRSG